MHSKGIVSFVLCVIVHSYVIQCITRNQGASTQLHRFRQSNGVCEPQYKKSGCNCANKGYCEDENNPKQCSCCFNNLYENPEKNCEEKNHCESNPCKNNGKCENIWGNYFCTCSSGYHGQNCETGGTQVERISKPQFLFEVVTAFNEMSAVFLAFDTFGSKFSFLFSMDEVVIVGDESYLERGTLRNSVVSKWTWLNSSKVSGKKWIFYYPHIESRRKENEQYKIPLSMTVNNAGVMQFSGDYTMYMVPQDSKDCSVAVQLDGCGRGTKDRVKMHRGNDYAIRATIIDPCNQKGKPYFQWQLCSIFKDVPYPLTDFQRKVLFRDSKKKGNCLDTNIRSTEFNIGPSSLDYGMYNFMVAVKPYKSVKASINMCWFQVTAAPLIAELVGGNARTVSIDTNLIVDASNSRDPNEPAGKKSHLMYKWSCQPEQSEVCSDVSKQTGSKVVVKPAAGTYTFYMTVSVDKNKAPSVGTYPEETLPDSDTATQTITVVKGKIPLLAIKCIKNCDFEVNSGEVLFLRAVCSEHCTGADKKGFYQWTVKPDEVKQEDTEMGLDAENLIINEKVLSPGKKYSITVAGEDQDSPGKAEIEITTMRELESELEGKKCSLSPSEGISGLDFFNCICDYPEQSLGFPLRFEIFQVPDPSKRLSEILVYYSLKNQMTNFLLAAGTEEQNYATKIYIRVEDHFGAFVKKELGTVTVKPIIAETEFKDVVDAANKLTAGDRGRPSLETYVLHGDMSGALTLISLLTVALDSSKNVSQKDTWHLKQQFLEAMDKVPMFQDTPLRQVTATLHLLFGGSDKTQDETLPVPYKSVSTAVSILQKVTRQLCVEINDPYVEFEVSTGELMNVSKMAIQTLQFLLSSMTATMNNLTHNTTSSNISTTTVLPAIADEDLVGPDYPTYFELETEYVNSMQAFKESSTKIVTCIENVGKAILHRLGEEQQAKTIEMESITSWIKIDTPDNLKNKLLGVGNMSQGLNISDALARAMQQKSSHIGVQVTLTKGNPFLWDRETDMNTGLVHISIYNQEIKPMLITELADLFVSTPANFTAQAAHGNVTVLLKSIHNKDKLEDCISVHKIEAKEGTAPLLIFEPLEDPSYKLQIVITIGVHPEMEHFEKYSETIPRSAQPSYLYDNLTVFVDGVSTKDTSWFYLGILPHPDTLESASRRMGMNANFTMKYSYHVKIIKCHSWNVTTMRWSSEGCKPGPKTKPATLHCLCTHLSMFSGSLLAPLSKDDFFQKIPMILLGTSNAAIPVFIATLLALYFMLLAWAAWKDKNDKNKRVVTVLEDNYPGRSYTYLIGVFTGWKKNAGTTSNVGIQLIGEKHRSMAHVLKDKTRVLHARNSSNWFVVFTAKDLGELQGLRLWHDNTGHSPPWFCEKVVVRDIQKCTVHVFIIQHWLSVVHKGSNVYYFAQPATPAQQRQESMLFRDNVKLGFQEQHIWTNIFMRHPWSTYTRVQRFTVLFCIITTTMVVSLLLYNTPEGNATDQIDEAEFRFPGRELGFMIVAALISSPLHFVVVLMFRKAVPRNIEYSSKAEAILVNVKLEKGETKMKWWQRIFYLIMLEPLIQVPSIQKTYKEYKTLKQELMLSTYLFPSWFIFVAWTVCIVLIVISSSVLILFGLMYPEVKSQMWVVAVLMYICFSIFIFQPLKVVIFSLILSFLCKTVPGSMHDVDVLYVREIDEEKELDRKKVLQLKNIRAKQMYHPLKPQDILRLGRRERTRIKLAELFTDLCMFIIYIITLYWLVLGTRDSMAFYSTNSIRQTVIVNDYFSELQAGHELVYYMLDVLIPAIHTEEWYNGATMSAAGVTLLYETRLLGLVRLRQLRVKNRTCDIVAEMRNIIDRCSVDFTFRNEDTNNYSIGWGQFEGEAHRNTRASVPWLHRNGWESGTVPERGLMAIYSAGGYITTLGRTFENSILIFNFLVEEKWLDHLSRALFIEFTTYNANTNVFNIVTLLVEMAALGAIHTSENIKTVKLLMSLEEFSPSILVAVVLWILVLLLFMVRQMTKFGRFTVYGYFHSWWNIIDLLILVLAVSTISLYFLRSDYVSDLIKELEEADGNEFVNFIWAAHWQLQLRYFTAILVCLSTARLWKLLRFLSKFRNFERTLVQASKALFSITIMMLVIIMGFACFSHIFLGHSSHLFSSLFLSISAMFTYGIGFGEVDSNEYLLQDEIIGSIFVLIFWFFHFIYLINIFVSIINIAYEQSHKEEGLFQADYTMRDYINEEMKYICKCWDKSIDTEREFDKQLSARQKYPQYFNEEKESEMQDMKKSSNNASPQVFLYLQETKRNWSMNNGHQVLNTETGTLQSALNTRLIHTKQMRLRAGADSLAEPVYVPAIALPKPDEIRLDNAEEIPPSRLEAMRHLVLNTIQGQGEAHQHAMSAVAIDFIQQSKPDEEKPQPSYFYRGLDGPKQKLISDDKLVEMETFLNKMGAHRYVAHMHENKHIQTEEDEFDEVESEDNVGYADVLARQMIKIHNIISDWKCEEKGEKDVKEKSDKQISKKLKKMKKHQGKESTDEKGEKSKIEQEESTEDKEIQRNGKYGEPILSPSAMDDADRFKPKDLKQKESTTKYVDKNEDNRVKEEDQSPSIPMPAPASVGRSKKKSAKQERNRKSDQEKLADGENQPAMGETLIPMSIRGSMYPEKSKTVDEFNEHYKISPKVKPITPKVSIVPATGKPEVPEPSDTRSILPMSPITELTPVKATKPTASLYERDYCGLFPFEKRSQNISEKSKITSNAKKEGQHKSTHNATRKKEKGTVAAITIIKSHKQSPFVNAWLPYTKNQYTQTELTGFHDQSAEASTEAIDQNSIFNSCSICIQDEARRTAINEWQRRPIFQTNRQDYCSLHQPTEQLRLNQSDSLYTSYNNSLSNSSAVLLDESQAFLQTFNTSNYELSSLSGSSSQNNDYTDSISHSSLLPPGFCSRCGYLMLSDDEKLLLVQHENQYVHDTFPDSPVTNEQQAFRQPRSDYEYQDTHFTEQSKTRTQNTMSHQLPCLHLPESLPHELAHFSSEQSNSDIRLRKQTLNPRQHRRHFTDQPVISHQEITRQRTRTAPVGLYRENQDGNIDSRNNMNWQYQQQIFGGFPYQATEMPKSLDPNFHTRRQTIITRPCRRCYTEQPKHSQQTLRGNRPNTLPVFTGYNIQSENGDRSVNRNMATNQRYLHRLRDTLHLNDGGATIRDTPNYGSRVHINQQHQRNTTAGNDGIQCQYNTQPNAALRNEFREPEGILFHPSQHVLRIINRNNFINAGNDRPRRHLRDDRTQNLQEFNTALPSFEPGSGNLHQYGLHPFHCGLNTTNATHLSAELYSLSNSVTPFDIQHHSSIIPENEMTSLPPEFPSTVTHQSHHHPPYHTQVPQTVGPQLYHRDQNISQMPFGHGRYPLVRSRRDSTRRQHSDRRFEPLLSNTYQSMERDFASTSWDQEHSDNVEE